jgi:hypothetical protein
MSAELFYKNLPKNFVLPVDAFGEKMLKEYGAMFVARRVTPPSRVVFKDESEVAAFQSGVQKSRRKIGGFTVELQTGAMRALEKAAAEALSKNLSISPRNADAAGRSYRQTLENWKSRVEPGLAFWVEKGRLTPADASRIRALPPTEQIPEIFRLESEGLFFAKGNQKTIIYSVAPPGTSQHIALLALDVAEFENPQVRTSLARFGWFQTVPSDVPHFTYLGARESELPRLGLKKVSAAGRPFWVPDLSG